MTTIVLEHVRVADLPADWRERIDAKPSDTVRVTIAKEARSGRAAKGAKPNRTFGMWSDRADIKDAGAYVRRLRQPRHPAVR